MKLDLTYPLPKKVLQDFAHKVFTPLKKGQCVTTLWVANGGKRFRINFLLKEKKILTKIFEPDFDSILFVNVHPDEISELSATGYLNLVLEKLQEQMEIHTIRLFTPKSKNPLRIVQEYLRYLLSLDKEVIFFLHALEVPLALPANIFANLESILGIDKKKIRFLFLSHVDLIDEKILLKMGNFKYAILRNVIYIPLFKDEEIDYLIAFNEKVLSLSLPKETKKILKAYFGGHPMLLKYSVSKLAKMNPKKLKDQKFVINKLISNFELKVATKEIWNALNKQEKDIVGYVINNGRLPPNSQDRTKHLLETGILKVDKKNLVSTFGKFFDLTIKKEVPVNKLSYNKELGEVFLGPIPCTDQFTPQEYEVLRVFLQKEGRIVSRDQVAKALWGEKSYDKYSDWAIDKVISTIRKKLNKIGFPSNKLSTLKKRGFKLSS